MKIALIEDEADCYENYQVLLEERGHDVNVYSDADAVVNDINSICKSDVIILDLMIQLGTKIQPDEASETGTAIYKRIRKIAPKSRIVILTARSRGDIWEDFENDNLVRYLGKPVSDLEKFYKTILEWN
jgi:DNA-binding NtrC family response regulator